MAEFDRGVVQEVSEVIVKRILYTDVSINTVLMGELVRCKDCKWFGDDNEDCGTCGFFEEARSANHYCSEGVRENGDDNG